GAVGGATAPSEDRVLCLVGAVEGLGEGVAADEPPAGAGYLLGGEGLIVDRPLRAQEVAAPLVNLRIEAASQPRREAEHGERSVWVTPDSEHQQLTLRAGTLEVRCGVWDARHGALLVRVESGERIESERCGDFPRAEDRAAQSARGGVQAGNVGGAH